MMVFVVIVHNNDEQYEIKNRGIKRESRHKFT
jgi:hypothetical protein